MAKKVIRKIEGKKYKIPKEVDDYLNELEHYFYLTIGKRVVEIHVGICGEIRGLFENFEEIPESVIGDREDFIKNIGVPINDALRNIKWVLVLCEDSNKYYVLPFVYWRVLPPESNDSQQDDDDDEVSAEKTTDV